MRQLLFVFLLACGSKTAPPPSDPATPPGPPPAEPGVVAAECKVTGCSGSLCVAANQEDMMTTCEMKPEYQCYAGAECKVQSTGACGWTMDDRMQKCLASPPPLQ